MGSRWGLSGSLLLLACSSVDARGPRQSAEVVRPEQPGKPPCAEAGWSAPAVSTHPAWSAALERPVWVGRIPGTRSRLVLEQAGRLQEIAEDGVAKLVGDISARVTRQNNEEGLLAMAFHPKYEENSRVFLYYSASRPRRSILSEFTMTDGRLDPSSEREILSVEQPYGNHNGGDVRFGPDDLLYLSLGDGGAGGDPHGHGQNTETLLGTVLRLDVDGGSPYAIPPDNPFANGGGGRPEIYAWGLRNPWRMAFDGSDLWVGDVGQNALEEVDLIRKGGNYGWNLREGDACFVSGCPREGLLDPIWTYGRDQGTSITGGLVYRGSALPELTGTYLVADFVSTRLWAVCPTSPARAVELARLPLMPASFGVDSDGEPIIVGFGEVSGVKLGRAGG